jgi:hypothetical protein
MRARQTSFLKKNTFRKKVFIGNIISSPLRDDLHQLRYNDLLPLIFRSLALRLRLFTRVCTTLVITRTSAEICDLISSMYRCRDLQ